MYHLPGRERNPPQGPLFFVLFCWWHWKPRLSQDRSFTAHPTAWAAFGNNRGGSPAKRDNESKRRGPAKKHLTQQSTGSGQTFLFGLRRILSLGSQITPHRVKRSINLEQRTYPHLILTCSLHYILVEIKLSDRGVRAHLGIYNACIR